MELTPTKIISGILISGIIIGGILYYSKEKPLLGEIIPSLNIGGSIVSMSYTDDNAGEDLIIRSDQKEYSGLSSIYPFISITNKVVGQIVCLSAPLLQDRKTSFIKMYDGLETVIIPEKIIPEKITSTSTIPQKIIPEQRYSQAIWREMPLSNRLRSSLKDTKGRFAEKESCFNLAQNETKFFQLKIDYPTKVSNEEFFIEAFGSLTAYGHLDPITYTTFDNFNSYTDGDLNGQGGWSGDIGYNIQGTTVQEGAKAVENVSDDWNKSISNTFAGKSSGYIAVYMRSTIINASNSMYFDLFEDAAQVRSIQFIWSDPNIIMQWDNNVAIASGLSINTWYLVEIEIDGANDKIRARVDGGTWSAWASATAYASINKVRLRADWASGSRYYDLIQLGVDEVAAVVDSSYQIIFEE